MSDDPASLASDPAPMRTLVRPAILVTILGSSAHLMSVLVQILIAHVYGAGDTVDAFFAATTLPQYVITVTLSLVPVVFIPVVAGYAGSRAELMRASAGVLAAFVALMSLCVLIGIAFASPLLHLVTPGLSANAHAIAVGLSWIAWPAVIATAVISLLTGTSHTQRLFVWPAIAAAAAAILNLIGAVALIESLGIYGVALAATASTFLQAALLYRLLVRRGELSLRKAWSHPAVSAVFVLFWPLAISGLLVKSTIVLERFLASGFPAGSISHVSYASRLVGLIAFVLSSGIGTVIFPSIASHVASERFEALGEETSKSMRVVWIAVAPAIAAGFVLAAPGVAAVFERGQFTPVDAASLAALLRIYLFSLIGGCLGIVTSRVIYALRLQKVVAVVGAIEAAAYVIYTTLLVRAIGIIGVAWGFAAFNMISLVWQWILIGRRTGSGRPIETMSALIRTTLAALAAGAAAAGAIRLTDSSWLQLVFGGAAALAVYVPVLMLMNPADATILRKAARQLSFKRGA